MLTVPALPLVRGKLTLKLDALVTKDTTGTDDEGEGEDAIKVDGLTGAGIAMDDADGVGFGVWLGMRISWDEVASFATVKPAVGFQDWEEERPRRERNVVRDSVDLRIFDCWMERKLQE